MSKSTPDIRRVVIPALMRHCPEFGRVDFRMVESVSNHDDLATDLDTLAGIDGYQRWLLGMRGIAVRRQVGKNYRTFTIRVSRPNGVATEYEKRLYAIEHKEDGCIYPYWTVHAYMNREGGDLLSVGVAKTAELYPYIAQNEKAGRKYPRRNVEDATFLYVCWDEYRRSGLYFYEYGDAPEEDREQLLAEVEAATERKIDWEEMFSIDVLESLLSPEYGMMLAENGRNEEGTQLL